MEALDLYKKDIQKEYGEVYGMCITACLSPPH